MPRPTTALFHLLLTLGALQRLAVSANAQKNAPTAPTIPSAPRSTNGGMSSGSGNTPGVMYPSYGEETSEADDRMENMRARSRAEERRKRMVEDANRLVALTTRYRAAVEDHGRETPEDARLLLDIEKLARSVKDRMRGM